MTAEQQTPLLATLGVHVTFGGVRAVRGVDIALEAGSLYGLIGPNGSGKTTMLGAISRVTALSAGRLIFDGMDYTTLANTAVARLGIARTFQAVRLVPTLNVLENVMLGADLHSDKKRGWRFRSASEQDARERAMNALERVGLARLAMAAPGSLSYGVQRRVEIARAVSMQPRLLLLDEPTAGMREDERTEVMHLTRGLVDEGMSVLLVEHNLRMINKICDHLFVMHLGSCIARGAPAIVMADESVRTAYIGKDSRVAG